MAIQGELRTLSFPDVIQWLDGSGKPGRLSVVCGPGERSFYLDPGTVARFGADGLYEWLARIARLLSLVDERGARLAVEGARSGMSIEDAFARAGVESGMLKSIACENVLQTATDLFNETSGSFHFTEDPEIEGDETVRVDVSLRELLYEGVRRLDEAGATAEIIGGDSVSVRPGRGADRSLSGLKRAALAAMGSGSTVGAVRLALGLSSGGASRLFYELWRSGLLVIEGAGAPRPDPLTQMLRQGARLLADGHFDAAELVFTSLLAADPSDHRVREFARAVEREHVDALYRELSPVSVPKLLVPESSLVTLRPDERIVASLINGKWDVSALVLASPLRELQTLRAVKRMLELNLVSTD